MFNPFLHRDRIPTPPKRLNNVERFSTYLMVDTQQGRVVLQWITQPRLRRNFQLYAARDPNFARLGDRRESALEAFWIDLALNPPPPQPWEPTNREQLALQHLASYYELICDKAAKWIVNKHGQLLWQDAFDIARTLVHDQEKLASILSQYQAKGDAKLSTYLQEVLIRTIKSEASVGRYSYWRLVCQTPQYKLIDALGRFGCQEPEISQIIFARKYFHQVYLFNRVKSPHRKPGEIWPVPQPEDFGETANCYNAERLLPCAPPEVAANPNPVTGEQMKAWMETCFEALKTTKKLTKECWSLDVLREKGREFAAPETESEDYFINIVGEGKFKGGYLNEAKGISERLETELRNCKNVIELQLENGRWFIDETNLLPLTYGFGLTQTQIAALCNLKQYQVSRKLSYYKTQLLNALTEISQPEEWVLPYVREWLQKYFPAPNRADIIQAALVEALKEITASERELLSLCYGEQLDVRAVGDRLGISPEEVEAKLNPIETQLHNGLLKHLDKWMKEYIKQWLYEVYQLSIQQVLIHHVQELPLPIQNSLQMHYQNYANPEQLAREVRLSESEDSQLFWKGRCQVEEDLVRWILEELNINLTGNKERERINKIVERNLIAIYKQGKGGQDNES